MKNIRILLMSIALLAGVGGAYAVSNTYDPCEMEKQYYKVDYYFYEAGQLGVNYYCIYSPASICTYYKEDPFLQPNTYTACKRGYFYTLF